MTPDSPIGVFDSGVGGLSVAGEIRALMPAEHLLYVADSAYCPYGGRPLEEIRDRTLAVGHFLLERGAKVLVVACNSASGAALEALRASTPIPVVGMEPAVKPAATSTRNGRVGIMATAATLQADRFDRLMESYAGDVAVVSQACPGLVELVESGITSGEEVRATLEPLLRQFRREQVDTVVLGCTHYPFLREAMQSILGPGVVLIDTGEAVARQTRRVLADRELLRHAADGGLEFFTTGDPRVVGEVARRLWRGPVTVEAARI